jgi:hypothetical protein
MQHRFARTAATAVLLPFAFLSSALGQEAPSPAASKPAAVAPDASPIHDEAPVEVSGTQPGPGLWKVARGGHVMWVLGTQSPLPRHMQWHSEEVEAALAASQEIIYAPSMGISVEAGGFFKGLFLLPRVYGARKNPDGKTLRDVLPAGLYARWLPLRQRYLGSGRGAERMRPLFAAEELWDEALDDDGLVASGIVMPVIKRAVKAHGMRETTPRKLLKITDAKALLAEVEHAQLNDTGCMEATVQRLEEGPERLRQRANAWAIGDVPVLRTLPDTDQRAACADAAMQSPVLRKRGGEGIDAEMERIWLEAAEKALAGNVSTFALLPIDDLLAADGGYVGKLAARGYEVTAPE